MALTAGLSLLTLLALQAAAQGTVYFEIGKNLDLDPKHPEAISSITWKHKGNIIAEYIKDVVPLEYLGDLKGRLKLNVTTGILTVSNMKKSDDGQFTVEINNRVLPTKFNAVGIRKLNSVEVILRPLTCNSDSFDCSLVCGGEFPDAEPAQYFWTKGESGEWQKGDKRLVISKETEQVETFACRVENRFSNVTSVPHANPYYKEPNKGGVVAAAVLVPLFILAVGAVIVALLIKKPAFVQNLLNRNSERPAGNSKELEGLNANSNPDSALNPPP